MGPADPESSRTSIHRDCTSFHTDSWQTTGLVGNMASVIPSWVLTNLFLSEISSPSPVREPKCACAKQEAAGFRTLRAPASLSEAREASCISSRVSSRENNCRPPCTHDGFSRGARAGKAHAQISGPFWGVGVWGTFWRALCFSFTIVICLGTVVSSAAGWMKPPPKKIL